MSCHATPNHFQSSACKLLQSAWRTPRILVANVFAREESNVESTQVATQNQSGLSEITFVSGPATTEDRDSRIRVALGLARGFLPRVRLRWLYNYYEHLASRLQLPFQARYAGDLRQQQPSASLVTVVGLVDPGADPDRESSGLLCKARTGEEADELPLADLEFEENSPNYQLIEDYWYWFWNWRFDPKI